MNGASLRALEESVRPVAIGGTLTLELGARAVLLNRDIARFHAALKQARRILGLAGVVDDRLRCEILARGAQLARAREALESELAVARAGEAGDDARAQP